MWATAGERTTPIFLPEVTRLPLTLCNNSGVCNEAGGPFDFSLDPAYYQTRWFKALCVIAFLALLWALHQYHRYQIAREFNVRLEERVNERTRIARARLDFWSEAGAGTEVELTVPASVAFAKGRLMVPADSAYSAGNGNDAH